MAVRTSQPMENLTNLTIKMLARQTEVQRQGVNVTNREALEPRPLLSSHLPTVSRSK